MAVEKSLTTATVEAINATEIASNRKALVMLKLSYNKHKAV
jgi:hypothetical protein